MGYDDALIHQFSIMTKGFTENQKIFTYKKSARFRGDRDLPSKEWINLKIESAKTHWVVKVLQEFY
jgi:hypothetical protein